MTQLRASFVTLIVIATVALATLTSALQRPPGPTTGAAVAGSALVLAIALAVATRMLLAVGTGAAPGRPPRRRPHSGAADASR